MRILCANVGSTSFKYQLLDLQPGSSNRFSSVCKGVVERIGNSPSYFSHTDSANKDGLGQTQGELEAADHLASVQHAINLIPDLEQIDGIGFKTVFAKDIWQSAVIDQSVIQALEAYIPLAPLHNPAYLATIRSFQQLLPQVPLVAVLETGFHQSIPDYAYDFGVPRSWMEKHRIRRYGFHGASHRWVSERVPEILNRPSKDLKIISCHLGGSSSLAAIREGKSIDTSMGVSTQYGVLQSTRVGDLDPFAALYVMAQEGWSPTEITRQLMEDSGLKGISGISGDMRDLESADDSGNDRARLAIQDYCYGVKKYIGAYTAALGSVDVLAYTGGIGEKSITARSTICDGLSWMGIELNPDKNRQNKPETLISSTDSRVKILIVPANEEFIVARETARLLSK